jgi:hypothetical protein
VLKTPSSLIMSRQCFHILHNSEWLIKGILNINLYYVWIFLQCIQIIFTESVFYTTYIVFVTTDHYIHIRIATQDLTTSAYTTGLSIHEVLCYKCVVQHRIWSHLVYSSQWGCGNCRMWFVKNTEDRWRERNCQGDLEVTSTAKYTTRITLNK